MPTSPCLITVLRTEAGETMVDLVNAITHMAEGGCSSRALQDTLGTCRGFFFFFWLSFGSEPALFCICHTSLFISTHRKQRRKERDGIRSLTITSGGGGGRERRREAEGERRRRYYQQLLLLRVQYIQAQSIKLLQTVTPKQTEESFSSDT